MNKPPKPPAIPQTTTFPFVQPVRQRVPVQAALSLPRRRGRRGRK